MELGLGYGHEQATYTLPDSLLKFLSILCLVGLNNSVDIPRRPFQIP